MCTTSERNGTTDASFSAVIVSSTARWRPASSAEAIDSVSPQRPCSNPTAIGACTEFRLSRVSSSHSASATAARAVVIVEVRARGEHLDGLEAMRRDLDQVLPVEALGVEQVRGDAEGRAQTPILTDGIRQPE